MNSALAAEPGSHQAVKVGKGILGRVCSLVAVQAGGRAQGSRRITGSSCSSTGALGVGASARPSTTAPVVHVPASLDWLLAVAWLHSPCPLCTLLPSLVTSLMKTLLWLSIFLRQVESMRVLRGQPPLLSDVASFLSLSGTPPWPLWTHPCPRALHLFSAWGVFLELLNGSPSAFISLPLCPHLLQRAPLSPWTKGNDALPFFQNCFN